MESVNLISFVFLFLIILIGIFSAGGNSCQNGAYFPAVFTRGIAAILIHLITSFILLFVFFVINDVITSEKHTANEKITAQTIGLSITFIYAFFGWILCCFTGGKIIKSFRDFSLSYSK